MTAKTTTQLQRPNNDSHNDPAEVMSYFANSATVFMHVATPTCWSDSSIAERAAILVFLPPWPAMPCLLAS